MTSFITVNQLYHLFERCSLAYHGVRHDPFQDYWSKVTSVSSTLAHVADDRMVVEFLRLLRRYRFEMTAAPLSYNNSLLVSLDQVSQVRRFARLARVTYPNLTDPIERVADSFLQLRCSGDNPLLAQIKKILSTKEPETAGVLVIDSRFIQPTRDLLISHSDHDITEILTPNRLHVSRGYDLLLVLGPTRWFPDHVFNAPRAAEIHVITYDWNLRQWEPQSSFMGARGEFRVRSTSRPSRVAARPLDEIERELDWEEIEQRWTARVEGDRVAEDSDAIAARLYLLEGGFAAFLDATGRRATLTIDPEADDSSRVKQLADRDIEVGMFVVIRADSDHGYILPIADRILGDLARPYREWQHQWKARLRAEVRKQDAFQVALKLIDLGSERADEVNVRNWMSETTIAPAKQSDFEAIARLTGLSNQSEEIWKMANSIRNAHLRAGIQVQKQLRNMVRSVDTEELEQKGMLEFELSDIPGGRLTAFRVEDRSDRTVFLPSSRIENAFRSEV